MSRLKDFIYRIFYFSQIHHLLRFFLRNKVIILCYHGFTDRIHEGIVNYDGKHLHAQKFERQLRYLKKYYTLLSFEDWLNLREKKEPIPPKALILTFDDGYESNFQIAFELLKRYEVPATIFLATDFLDGARAQWTDQVEWAAEKAPEGRYRLTEDEKVPALTINSSPNSRLQTVAAIKTFLKNMPQRQRDETLNFLLRELKLMPGTSEIPAVYRPLTWNQVREMRRSGLVSFGSHTRSHVILSRCGGELSTRELSESRAKIEKEIGEACTLFCYPNGMPGDFNQATREAVQKAGYRCAATCIEGFNDSAGDPYEIKRFGFKESGTDPEFAMTLGGVKLFFSKIKAALKNTLGTRGGKVTPDPYTAATAAAAGSSASI